MFVSMLLCCFTAGILLALIMTLSTGSVISTIFVLILHHKEPVSRVPACIRFIFFEIVAKVFCLYSHVQHYNSGGSSSSGNESKSLDLQATEEDIPSHGLSDCLESRQEVRKKKPQTSAFRALYAMQYQIEEVAGQLKIMTGQSNEKDDEQSIVQEWQLLAIIVDRLIFCLVVMSLIGFGIFLLRKLYYLDLLFAGNQDESLM